MISRAKHELSFSFVMSSPAHRSLFNSMALGICLQFARQGFALGLTVVLESVRAIRVEAIMKLIPSLLEYSSSMKGLVP
jgi:hypothetical protein